MSIGELYHTNLHPAVAIGTGPSFFEWVKNPTPGLVRYGCGVASKYLRLDYYALGDSDHYSHIPPGVPTYATERVLSDPTAPAGLMPFDEHVLPHGGSSGGMAVSLAARNHRVVYLIGFDGFGEGEEVAGFVEKFSDLLEFWQGLGRKFYSLMPSSVFSVEKAKL